MSFIAPAGTPVGILDLVRGLGAGLVGSASREALSRLLAERSRSGRAWLVSSGRAAMSLAFEAMKRAAGPGRTEVVMPGYTCYSVPAAAERAGLQVRLCDIDPATLTMRADLLEEIDCSRVLCVVTANLYGMPNDLAGIEAFARRHGIFMLDDAAQALGATAGARPAGGFGSVGLYSLDKGKNITTIQGGALVSGNSELSRHLDELLQAWPAASSTGTASLVMKLGIYSLLLRPSLYGITRRLPFLGLGRTPYDTRCTEEKFSECLSGLALQLARRLDDINAVRVRNANSMRAALDDLPGITCVRPLPDTRSVYCRFPILAQDPSQRDRLIGNLQAAGIGATASYPLALADVPELRGRTAFAGSAQEGARHVARSIITLPTHAYSPPDLATKVREIILQTMHHQIS